MRGNCLQSKTVELLYGNHETIKYISDDFMISDQDAADGVPLFQLGLDSSDKEQVYV